MDDLTPTETLVLRYLKAGYTPNEIAALMHYTPQYVLNVIRTFGVIASPKGRGHESQAKDLSQRVALLKKAAPNLSTRIAGVILGVSHTTIRKYYAANERPNPSPLDKTEPPTRRVNVDYSLRRRNA